MPIRHTSRGWWWGSKGPFRTKAEAVQAARNAYGHGYKPGGERERHSQSRSKNSGKRKKSGKAKYYNRFRNRKRR